jgi:hypothetical protein
MKFIAQRLRVVGLLFAACSILYLPPIAVLSQRYVSKYLTEPYDLNLLGNDMCMFPIAFATIAELLIVGLVSLAVSFLLTALEWLRLRLSN